MNRFTGRFLPAVLLALPFAAVLALAAGCITSTVDPTTSLRSDTSRLVPLPKLANPVLGASEFKSDSYLEAAIRLQAAGKERAVETLKAGGDESFALCRMLFKAKPDRPFRRPGIGGTYFTCTKGSAWPLEPIEIVDRVPFCPSCGLCLLGVAEGPDEYVDWCVRNCDWNEERFTHKSAEEKQAALEKLLASLTWESIGFDNRKLFSEQIK